MGNVNSTLDWESMSEEEFGKYILEQHEDQEAVLTTNDMDAIERYWKKDMPTRRCNLIAMTISWKEFNEKVLNDRKFAEAVAEAHVCINPKFYEEIAALMGKAQTWAMVALAGREDMKELLEKAESLH